MGDDTRNGHLMVALNVVGTVYFDQRPAGVKIVEKRIDGTAAWDQRDVYVRRASPT